MWKPEVMSLAQPPAAAGMSAEESEYTRAASTAASPLRQPPIPIGQQRRNNIPHIVPAEATSCVVGSSNMVTSTHSHLFLGSCGVDATYSAVAAAAATAVPTATARGAVAASAVPRNILSRLAAAAAARSVSAAGTSPTVTCPAAPALPNKIFDCDGSAAARASLQNVPFKDSEEEKSTKKEAGKENYYSTTLQLEDEIYAIAREVRDPEFPTFSLGDLGVVTPELVCVTKQPSPLTWPTRRGRCSQRLSSSNKDSRCSEDVNSGQSNSNNRESSNSWEVTVATDHASSSRSTSRTRKASSSRYAYNGGSHRRQSVTSSNVTDGECPSSTRASSTIRSSRRCSTSSSPPMQQRKEKRLSKVHAPNKGHVRVGDSRRANDEVAGDSNHNSKKHSNMFCIFDSSSTATEDPVCQASRGSSTVDELPEKRQTGHCNASSRTSRSLFMRSRDSSTDESESNSEEEEGRESDDSAATVATVGLKPTNARCSLASLIGLAVRCKLEQHFVSDSPLLTLWPQQGQGQGQHAEEDSQRVVQQGEQHQRRAGRTPTQRPTAEQRREQGEAENLVVAGEALAEATGRDDSLQSKRVQQCSDICDYGRGKGRRRRLHFNIEVVEHEDAAALTKQLNDKERCFAALEGNPAVAELVWAAVEEDRPDA